MQPRHYGNRFDQNLVLARSVNYSVPCFEMVTRDQVNHHAESGARLVCAEAIGYVRSSSTNEQYAGKRF